jgi:hypothetical protein
MPRPTLEQVKADALARLFAIPGVTGVGLGPKIVGGKQTRELAIMVFTSAKKPLEQIPAAERIPSDIDGYKTDVVEAGAPVRTASVALEPLEDNKKYSTLRGGLSISGGGSEGSGTMGCIAETTDDYASGAGRIVLLTNHHVLFSENANDVSPHCNISVGQSTPACCCPACDFWGDIVAHIRTNSVASADVDGAIAELKPGTVWRPEIEDEDASGNPAPIKIEDVLASDLTAPDIMGGYAVWKRGKRTRRTTGNVISVNMSFPNGHPTSIVIAPDLTTCPFPTTAAYGIAANQVVFDYPGDSGSLLLNSDNVVVGLIWGLQGPQGNGLACAIGAVQFELNIKIKTMANTANPAQDQVVAASNDTSVTPKPKLPLDDRLILPASPGDPVYVARRPSSNTKLDALLRTPRGQEYTALAFRHREELLRLVNTNRRVATVWHRNGGPPILNSITHLHDDLRFPDMLDGQPLEARLKRIVGIFERYGSDTLRADIERCRPQIIALAHLSFKEIVDSLSQDHVRAG